MTENTLFVTIIYTYKIVKYAKKNHKGLGFDLTVTITMIFVCF